MNRIDYIILLFSVCGLATMSAQTSHKYLRQGNSNYEKQDFAAAEEMYRKSNQKESNLKANFNLGNATYQQGRYEEAVDHYMAAISKTEDPVEESNAYYNLGNAYYQNQNLNEAINAYKKSISLNSENENAQYNLSMAKIMKMMQQQQQNEQQPSDDNSENQDQQENEQDQDQQENPDGQNQETNEEENEQNEQEDKSEEEQNEEQNIEESSFDSTRLEKQSLDSIDAAKLLQIIQGEEQKVHEKLRKFNSKKKKQDKDW